MAAAIGATATPFYEPLKWKSTGPLVKPISDSKHALVSIKDPTVVQFDGKWHLFATVANTAGGWNMVYLNFTDWSEAGAAKQVYLDSANSGLSGYHCAPQVFYFRPHKKWYLIYQSQQPQYSTADDLSKPETWTKPQNLYASNPPGVPSLWLDYWIICDDKNAYLFSSGDDGRFYRCQTKLEDFPNGFSTPVVVMETPNRFDLFEACCVYRLKGKNQYLAFIECIGKNGNRYFKSFLSDRLDGEWTPHAATESNPFAGLNNMSYEAGVAPWTRDISHGELLRDGYDETLTVDPERMQLLYQGLDQATPSGVSYSQLPYQLALLRQDVPIQAPKITRQPQSLVLPEGSPFSLHAEASGYPTPAFQWRRGAVDLSSGTFPELIIPSMSAADAGTYSVLVSNSAGSVTSEPVTVSIATASSSAPSARLSALSVRSVAGSGAATLIAGVVVEGSTSRSLLLRGSGPDLLKGGVTGILNDPELVLYSIDGTAMATNDNWDQTTRSSSAFDAVVRRVGLGSYAEGAKDAALLSVLDSGAYTLHLRGKEGATGVGMIELYDCSTGTNGRLKALAVSSHVGTDDQVLIAGFVISGTNPLSVVVRGVGPVLEGIVPGFLADPTLAVVSMESRQTIAQNDNWQDSSTAAATKAAIEKLQLSPLPSGSKDAALVVNLAPGAYSAVVSGTGRQTGIAIVEIYELL